MWNFACSQFATRLLATVFVFASINPTLSAAKKETSADMSGASKIFIGWADLGDDWKKYGYGSHDEWADVVKDLNAELLAACQKDLPGKTVTAAKQSGDEHAAGNDLFIKFTDVQIDAKSYKVTLAMHFIDPKTNKELAALPARVYPGKGIRFEAHLKSAMDDVGEQIGVEVTGGETAKPKKKILGVTVP